MKLDHLQSEIVWVLGKDNEEADALSRAPFAVAGPGDALDEDDEELLHVDTAHIAVCLVTEVNAVDYTKPDLRVQRPVELRRFANEDEDLRTVHLFIVNGFPSKQSDVPDKLHSYWNFRDSLTIDDDNFTCKGSTLVVPTDLRPVYISCLLSMHQWPDKMMERAKRSVWWPYMKRDFQTADQMCKPCQENKPSNRPETQINHEPATYPFQFLHMDLGAINSVAGRSLANAARRWLLNK